MTFISFSHRRGFTLIELLVVIAIIGILASVVLASINTARQKGRNAKRISDVQQYMLALELVFDSTGAYPGDTNWRCLGDYDDDECWTDGNQYSELPALNTALTPFITGLPAGDVAYLTVEGYVYRRLSSTQTYEIRWYMEGDNVSCGPGKEITGSYADATYCQFVK